MAKFALSKGYKKAAILTDEKQAYSKGLAQYFTEVFTKNGGQIVKEQSYSSGDKDFRAQLTSLKSAKPDVIFLPGYYNEVALIARQARQFGLKVPFMGGDGWEGDSLLKVAGNALDGCYFSSHFSADNQDPVIQRFIAKYKAKYGMAPDCQAALGYDTVRILAEAIQRAGSTDSKAIRDAVAATKDFAGVTGKITIDTGRNASKPAVVQTIGGGAFKFVENVEPSGRDERGESSENSPAIYGWVGRCELPSPAGAKERFCRPLERFKFHSLHAARRRRLLQGFSSLGGMDKYRHCA